MHKNYVKTDDRLFKQLFVIIETSIVCNKKDRSYDFVHRFCERSVDTHTTLADIDIIIEKHFLQFIKVENNEILSKEIPKAFSYLQN